MTFWLMYLNLSEKNGAIFYPRKYRQVYGSTFYNGSVKEIPEYT